LYEVEPARQWKVDGMGGRKKKEYVYGVWGRKDSLCDNLRDV
jgi:hypothetical protein